MSPEWTWLITEFDKLGELCKEVIDTQELSGYDVEDLEIYLSERGDERIWSVVMGDQWIDIVTSRFDKCEDPSEIAFEMSEVLRNKLKEHINARGN